MAFLGGDRRISQPLYDYLKFLEKQPQINDLYLLSPVFGCFQDMRENDIKTYSKRYTDALRAYLHKAFE